MSSAAPAPDPRLTRHDLTLPDGRSLAVFDTGPEPAGGPAQRVVWWHHGSPNVGWPPTPLFDLADQLGVRWIGHTRPGYPGSTRQPDRTVGGVADDVAAAADALGVGRFAVMGHSGGGAHALACAALLGDRVTAAASLAGLAPYDAVTAAGLDWFDGFGPGGAAELRVAVGGADALTRHLADADDEPEFTAADEEALGGDWAWFVDVVRGAFADGGLPDGFVDDDVAAMRPWGFDLAQVLAPSLFVHGSLDRVVPLAHGRWNGEHVADGTWWPHDGEGHVSVMRHAAEALGWLLART